MNFRTQVELPEKEAEICLSEQIMLFGSCFTENIGKLLVKNKFRCDMNPFGILYNPLSIAQALRMLLERKTFQEQDLFLSNGMWHSWMHHSDFSADTSEKSLCLINNRLEKAQKGLLVADWLIVTWGTAYVFYHKESGTVVGNCHKQPERCFQRERLSVEEMVTVWSELLQDVRKVNPKLKVLFTVSPIRHSKDGMHGNQLSKAALLLAISEICEKNAGCHYFPSYEIVLDELRDYRFYADDMLHPSQVAIDYIWECFTRCYFMKETQAFLKAWDEVCKGIQHKPFHPDSDAYRAFLSQIVLKIRGMKEKMPYLDMQKELDLCEIRLKI